MHYLTCQSFGRDCVAPAILWFEMPPQSAWDGPASMGDNGGDRVARVSLRSPLSSRAQGAAPPEFEQITLSSG